MDILHTALVFITGALFGGFGSIIVVSAVIVGSEERDNKKKVQLSDEVINSENED